MQRKKRGCTVTGVSARDRQTQRDAVTLKRVLDCQKIPNGGFVAVTRRIRVRNRTESQTK